MHALLKQTIRIHTTAAHGVVAISPGRVARLAYVTAAAAVAAIGRLFYVGVVLVVVVVIVVVVVVVDVGRARARSQSERVYATPPPRAHIATRTLPRTKETEIAENKRASE